MENTGGRRNRRACRGYLYDRFDVYQGTRERMRGTRQQSGYQPYKRGLNSKLHLAVDGHETPARAGMRHLHGRARGTCTGGHETPASGSMRRLLERARDTCKNRRSAGHKKKRGSVSASPPECAAVRLLPNALAVPGALVSEFRLFAGLFEKIRHLRRQPERFSVCFLTGLYRCPKKICFCQSRSSRRGS